MEQTDSKIELLKALAVTAELTSTEFSAAAATVMADDLEQYPIRQVMVALTRCRRELRGKLTIAAILERLDDGRPSANEAWAMIPQDEGGSVVWTDEMAAAFGFAAPLLSCGQVIAARSAFIEAYERAVSAARADMREPRWSPSLGWDPSRRAAAIETAQRHGRITDQHANTLLPAPVTIDNVLALPSAKSGMPDTVRKQLQQFKAKVNGDDRGN